ncbi:hypothetical protein [Flammeovirga agarivorans]|uniref:Uncharacterized protein n=1 Tax=Flammeovirga agarivorans TaxID=2726742 RepID=A0A7X8SR22_9BACT|nr:hypothetical protein [Flammeovirga agarivorans]NLR94844.1 hypothetical protein [Flammeovirga agarivorans]
MSRLKPLENQIISMLKKDKASWKKIGEMMYIVKRDKLYLEEGSRFSSFTQFVIYLSHVTEIAQSYIWRIFKATNTFLDILESDNPQDILRTVATPTQLESFSKIKKHSKDDAVVEDLQQSILEGSIETKELTEAWDLIKAPRLEDAEFSTNLVDEKVTAENFFRSFFSFTVLDENHKQFTYKELINFAEEYLSYVDDNG